MQKFIITTENTADLPHDILSAYNIKTINLHYYLDEKEYPCENFDPTDFYGRFRRGAKCSTSQPSYGEFSDFFTALLDDGYDVLHLSFASVLSGTYANATSVANELREKYPDRKLYVVDTKSEAGGQGLLVYLTAQKQQEGLSIDECYEYAESTIQRINHIFTINDLRTLVKTGRVSGAEAFIGNILQIKPLCYTAEDGKLTPYQKIVSRKLALNALCNKVGELYDGDCKTIFISQSDCAKDTEYVANKLRAIKGVNDVRIFSLNPVIGCHTGAETIAVFFTGKSRAIKPKG